MASAEMKKDVIEVREGPRDEWLKCLTALVDSIEGWARELGWSTRRIEKQMKDSEIGDYEAPALLMQEETTRALLDPIGRSAVGAEGVVDLYMMPAFDDIARLVHRDGQWWLHVDEVEPRSLSRESLRGALESMKNHAG